MPFPHACRQALPYALTINNTRVNVPNIILTNSGELRYDIFAGAFDKNDQLTALPFADSGACAARTSSSNSRCCSLGSGGGAGRTSEPPVDIALVIRVVLATWVVRERARRADAIVVRYIVWGFSEERY